MPAEPLPLFPLHTVLFPRMPLPLHIFEERYRQMIHRCIDEDRPFGVVLIREGNEVGQTPVPQRVGTLARIHAVKELREGRLNILAVGTERFRLLDYDAQTEPYMLGVIEPVCDEATSPHVLAPLVADVQSLFHEYFHLLTQQAGVDMPEYELPENPEELSFVIAAAVQMDNATRQEFLEMTDTAARLLQEKDLLTREIERINAMSHHRVEEARRLSAAKIKEFLTNN